MINISILDKLQADVKRVTVIHLDTLLDDCFKKLLILFFSQRDKEVKKLFDPSIGGPLVSLTHKARLAYALGLIDKMALYDLEHIHKIRNEFAHNVEASFAKTKVIKFVGKLSTAKDHKVTAKNSYKFYEKAYDKCYASFIESVIQEIDRQGILPEAKIAMEIYENTTKIRKKPEAQKKQK